MGCDARSAGGRLWRRLGVNRQANRPRATSSRVRTDATTATRSKATSTTSCTAAASMGDAPPSNIPTKAPGRVTRPTVLVWSRPGTRARPASALPMSRRASRSMNPRARAASTSPWRDVSASMTRRPARLVAVMAPPTRMPITGTTEIGRTGTSPEPRRAAATGRAPTATGIAAQTHRPPGDTRRPAVTLATTTMRLAKAAVRGHESRTAAMTAPTTASWAVARAVAVSWARP